ncbi:hypothetical protein [Gemmata sp.]|uniref:hypothetical protein n=1 Tax=Gemmata sp. TaxID=1914242 RepID=UPI003F717D1E
MPFVTCPECGHESHAPRDLIGLTWDCPECAEPIEVEGDRSRGRSRRSRGGGNGGRWVVLGVLLAAAVAAAVVVGARWSRPQVVHVGPGAGPGAGPVPVAPTPALPLVDVSGDGPDWTYRELAEYLRSRGLAVRLGNARRGPFLVFTTDGTEYPVVNAQQLLDLGALPVDTVEFQKCPSARAARETAGQSESGTFAWGRWCFSGREGDLDRIRRALP